MPKYLINTSKTTVSMLDGQITLPVGEWIEISNRDAEHQHVEDAVRRGWVSLKNTPPTDKSVPFKQDFKTKDPDVIGTTVFPKDKVKEPVIATTELKLKEVK